MPRDVATLQAWYRGAMRTRIDELRGLRAGLSAHAPGSFDAARRVGQALRGSGATFGFPQVTAWAALLETSPDGEVLRRVEGMIAALFTVAEGAVATGPDRAEWLLVAVDLPIESGLLDGALDMAAAWDRVCAARSLDAEALAERVARYLNVPLTTVVSPGRSAARLVPEALVAAARIVPLSEDAGVIHVATSDPTSLSLELELSRVTGRAPRLGVASPSAIEGALAPGKDPGATPRPSPVPGGVVPGVGVAGLDPSWGRVLVVDDDESSRLVMRRVLEADGHAVEEARDGLEALEALRGDAGFGLVVADLHMPEMDGLDLVWTVRADRRLAATPVIVVTGDVDPVLETQLLEEGADDYLRKPVDARLLAARVDAVFRRRVPPRGSAETG